MSLRGDGQCPMPALVIRRPVARRAIALAGLALALLAGSVEATAPRAPRGVRSAAGSVEATASRARRGVRSAPGSVEATAPRARRGVRSSAGSVEATAPRVRRGVHTAARSAAAEAGPAESATGADGGGEVGQAAGVPPAPGSGGAPQAMAGLSSKIDALAHGEAPPPWASGLGNGLDQRMERLLEMQERMAARIETPVPRLDEPIILLSVATCTGLLGFLLGRSAQRRRERREGQFRL